MIITRNLRYFFVVVIIIIIIFFFRSTIRAVRILFFPFRPEDDDGWTAANGDKSTTVRTRCPSAPLPSPQKPPTRREDDKLETYIVWCSLMSAAGSELASLLYIIYTPDIKKKNDGDNKKNIKLIPWETLHSRHINVYNIIIFNI